ncbi:putative lysophosphatidic acid:oleoyl-CoA acyltransferase [Erysiphe necator]|uniref:Putative vacuolar protein sorting protein vps66 n=1 Tax=Uncinula necator TaxID=52586 RepID=A0A0B1NZ74_UNCNE|nr:putative lysophosphatidic acid:oleoyl-CoA acyltransferase [Erysiphe necator]KHJ31268.1 putative vacuolar protein sorting protein vps66 [Erysiphe necator]
MEKYSQFRDRGSGVAPFFPIKAKSSGKYLPIYILLFIVKFPFIIIAAIYFLLLQWLPLAPVRKAMLWILLGIPGLWWIELQIDGVRKGSLAKKHAGRIPGPSDVIASSFTSPIDALYLAAIFDPIFTISYPHTEKVQIVSLLSAIFRALAKPEEYPPKDAKMTDIKTIVADNQDRAVVVFPECTTSNGLGILRLCPSLLTVSSKTKIFPLHLRYTPPNITTPIPWLYFSFLWNLLATPTHSIRVHIAKPLYNNTPSQVNSIGHITITSSEIPLKKTTEMNTIEGRSNYMVKQTRIDSLEEKNVLDKVGNSLALLGRVPRVGLTVRDKIKFIEAWRSI